MTIENISLLKNKMNLIDLSHPLINGLGSYPGGSAPEFTWHSTFETNGRTSSIVKLSTHSGTHVDAPLHFIPGGSSIDQVPLTSLSGYARIVDVSKCPVEKHQISENAFFESAKNLARGEIAVIYTGLDKLYGSSDFISGMVALPSACVKWLIEQEIRAYATDAYSVDLLNSLEFINHRALLEVGIPIIEALNNISVLQHKERFFLTAFPLNLQGREASPCRAIAILDL
jgi:arylformamidase